MTLVKMLRDTGLCPKSATGTLESTEYCGRTIL